MLKDFKAFVMRGNVLDLAVAVVIGTAFGKIITSLVDDVLMPPLGLLLGRVDFTELFLDLTGGGYATLAAAQAAGAPVLRYGLFLNALVSFLLIALAVFMVVRHVKKLLPADAPAAPATRECPACLSVIPLGARRCAHCTSELPAAA